MAQIWDSRYWPIGLEMADYSLATCEDISKLRNRAADAILHHYYAAGLGNKESGFLFKCRNCFYIYNSLTGILRNILSRQVIGLRRKGHKERRTRKRIICKCTKRQTRVFFCYVPITFLKLLLGPRMFAFLHHKSNFVHYLETFHGLSIEFHLN